jgi:transposase
LGLPKPQVEFRLCAVTKLSLNVQEMSVSQLLTVIEQLAAENAQLRAELEQLKRSSARSAAPFSKNQRKKNPQRPGRKAGQGPFRHRAAPPEEQYTEPLEEVPVTETACPECGGELLEAGTEIVTNTELPPLPKPEVKAYRVHLRCCAQCQRKVRGRHAAVAPGQWGATAHRLGPRAQAAAAGLHYGEGVPQRKVPGILKCLTGLSVTQGALTQAALRLGTKQGPVAQRYEQLRKEIKEQPAIHTDDTGWRIHGLPAHLMVFESKPQVVFQIRPQHRNEEVREVIGDHYAGTLCTDRGKSYDARELEEVAQQKCVPHLQRSINDVLKSKTGRAREFGEILKSQLKDGGALYQEFHQSTPPSPDYAARVQALELEVDWHLRPRPLKDADNQRLLNEIGRHHARGNVLRFLHEPATVEPTNNAAERALRPAVIARKVSQCSKSESGAQAFAAFKSVIGTLKKSGGEVLEKLTALIAGTPPPSPALENTS